MMDTKATQKLIVVEIIGFVAVIAIVWLNELLDLPNMCFNADPTPVNLAECFIETVLITILGLSWFDGHLYICESCVTWKVFYMCAISAGGFTSRVNGYRFIHI